MFIYDRLDFLFKLIESQVEDDGTVLAKSYPNTFNMLHKVKVDTHDSYEENTNESGVTKENDNGSTLAKFDSDILQSNQKVRTSPKDSYDPSTNEIHHPDSVEEESILMEGKAKTFHGLQQFDVDQLESLEHDSIEKDRNLKRIHEKSSYQDKTDSLSSESRSDMKMREYDHYEQNSFEDDTNDGKDVGSENFDFQHSRKPKDIVHASSRLDTKEDSGSFYKYENLDSNELGNIVGRLSVEVSSGESDKDTEEITKDVKVDIKQGVSKIDETVLRSNVDALNKRKSAIPIDSSFSTRNDEPNTANLSNHGDPDFYFHGRYAIYMFLL